MTDRDRLIELHHEAGVEWDNYLFECIDNDKMPNKTYDEFHADHLLANGVIVPVRCKECKGCELSYPRKEIGKKARPFLFCTLFERETKADGYCECGVRRNEKSNLR